MINKMKDLKLNCWLEAKDLAVRLYNVSQNGNLNHDSYLQNQMRKTAVLVASHIAAENNEKRSNKIAGGFLSAESFAEELRTQLAISRDIGYLSEGDFLDLEDRTIRLISQIGSLIESRD
jgi:four helix bundle protein